MVSLINRKEIINYMTYHVHAYDIDYCVEPEDLDNSYISDNQIDKEIKRIKKSLPKTLDFVLECDFEDIEDLACDYITETTNWLINSFRYRTV